LRSSIWFGKSRIGKALGPGNDALTAKARFQTTGEPDHRVRKGRAVDLSKKLRREGTQHTSMGGFEREELEMKKRQAGQESLGGRLVV